MRNILPKPVREFNGNILAKILKKEFSTLATITPMTAGRVGAAVVIGSNMVYIVLIGSILLSTYGVYRFIVKTGSEMLPFKVVTNTYMQNFEHW